MTRKVKVVSESFKMPRHFMAASLDPVMPPPERNLLASVILRALYDIADGAAWDIWGLGNQAAHSEKHHWARDARQWIYGRGRKEHSCMYYCALLGLRHKDIKKIANEILAGRMKKGQIGNIFYIQKKPAKS